MQLQKLAILEFLAHSIFRIAQILSILIFSLWYKSIFSIFISCFEEWLVRSFYIWTFLNFPIRNVSHSKMLLFEILTVIQNWFEKFFRVYYVSKKISGLIFKKY